MKKLILCNVLMALLVSISVAQEGKKCNFFVVTDVGGEIVIEKEELIEGQTHVFADDDIVSYIMVFSPGSKSGELIQKANRSASIIARYENEKIYIKLLNIDGTSRDMPDLSLSDAYDITIRFNATGANGFKKSWRIENWEIIIEDYGPVMDMFAGRIQLNDGDYSFFTESLESITNEQLSGEIPYKIIHNWITVKGYINGKFVGLFVIDFGATSSVINKEVLPEDISITSFKMVEYSAKGKKESNATVTGATGQIDNISGITILPQFSFGELELHDYKITVLNEFPDVFKEYGVVGLIGLDLLQRSGCITFSGIHEDNGNKRIIFSDTNEISAINTQVLKYELAASHLFIEGKIQGKPMSFLLDTGAGISVIRNQVLNANYINYEVISEEKKTGMGLDGTATEYDIIEIEDLSLNDITLDKLECMLLETKVFDDIGLHDNGVLLGMNFLLQYDEVCFDLLNKEIILGQFAQ